MRLAFTASLLTLPLAAGCGGHPGEAVAPRTEIHEHLEADPATLDPLAADDGAARVIGDFLYTPLVSLDREMRVGPGLATAWSVSPDGRTWDFLLDPAATFDDGRPVTAGDVRYTIDRLRDPRSASPRHADFDSVEEIREGPGGQVSVRFREAYSERLLAFTVPIVPESAHRSRPDFGRRPVGSGPYRLVRWEPGRSILLEKRRDGGPGAPRVLFRILPDTAAWVREGLLGELDAFRIPQASAARLSRDPAFARRFRTVTAPRLAVSDILWNCANPLLSDSRARTALSRATPRRRIIDALYAGRAREATGPYPAGVPENDPGVPPSPHSPEEAARLLRELGYTAGADGVLAKGGRRFSLELLVPAGRNASEEIGQVLQAEWRRIGVEVRLRSLDWAALRERIEAGDFEATLEDTEFYPPNLDPYDAFHSGPGPGAGGGGSANYGRFSDREADRLMEDLRRARDPARRLELFRAVHRRLAALQPCAFLFTVDSLWAVDRALAGVEISPLGLSYFSPGRPSWRFRPPEK